MANKSNNSGHDINIKTQAVRNAADKLSKINTDIDMKLLNVSNAIKTLDNNWEGIASGKAIAKYNQMKSEFLGAGGRKAVMNEYIRFLREVVAQGYEETEETNKSLSELFK